MLSDYNEPYTTHEHREEVYRIIHFKNLDPKVFHPNLYPIGVFTVETYYEDEGDWDIMYRGSKFKTFAEADEFVQERILEDVKKSIKDDGNW